MKFLNPEVPERKIVVEFTEAELREIQYYAEYFAPASTAARDAAARCSRQLASLNLGHRRNWDKLFKDD